MDVVHLENIKETETRNGGKYWLRKKSIDLGEGSICGGERSERFYCICVCVCVFIYVPSSISRLEQQMPVNCQSLKYCQLNLVLNVQALVAFNRI